MRTKNQLDIPALARASLPLHAALLLALAGCQSYEPRPLDAAAAQRTLAARSAESTEVAEFARLLADADKATLPDRYDPSDGLSLAEAEVVALVYNPQLRIKRMEVGVARATSETAGIWDDPVTGFNLNDVLTRNGGVTMGAQFSLTIPISGRLDAEKERAGAALTAKVVEVQLSEWETRLALRRAWAEWSSDRDRLDVVETTLRALDTLLSIVDSMERIGELPRVEARLFRVERATLLADGVRLRAQVQADEVVIKRIMGLAAWASVQIVPGAPLRPSVAPAAELRQTVVERSPNLAWLRAEYEVAEKALATEIRKQYPDIEIGPGYNTDGNQDFIVGVQFPLPLWNHNQQGVAQALAQREVARARFETALELQLSELESASIELASAAAQRQHMETEVVPLVDAQQRESARIAELGEVNALLQLESLTQRQRAMMALIQARLSEWLAMIGVEQALGPPPTARPAPPTPSDPIPPHSPPAEDASTP